LKVAPSTATRELTAQELPGQVDGPPPLPVVDLVDLVQEGHGLPHLQFLGPSEERADVLGQTAAAEPEARGQEGTPDAGVMAEGLGQGHHVGARGVTHLRHGVDEGDLRRQEGVGGDLHQFRGGGIGADVGDTGLQHRFVDVAQCPVGVGRGDSHDQPVGAQRVLDGESLAQELRVPGHLGVDARANL
jgi:hypothetical protein